MHFFQRTTIKQIALVVSTGLLIPINNNALAQTKIQNMTTQVSSDYPPFIPAPRTATPVIVTVELIAKDPQVLEQHLARAGVIPTTRLASGINYSWTIQDRDNPNRFVLIQQWNSAEQQQGYIAWREERGNLAELRSLLSQDPVVNYLSITDSNTLPAQIK